MTRVFVYRHSLASNKKANRFDLIWLSGIRDYLKKVELRIT